MLLTPCNRCQGCCTVVKDYLGRCGRAVSPAGVQRAAVTGPAQTIIWLPVHTAV